MVKSIYKCVWGKSGGKIISDGNILCSHCGKIKLKTGSVSIDYENAYKSCYEKLEMIEYDRDKLMVALKKNIRMERV